MMRTVEDKDPKKKKIEKIEFRQHSGFALTSFFAYVSDVLEWKTQLDRINIADIRLFYQIYFYFT